jgi:hypothetical protein
MKQIDNNDFRYTVKKGEDITLKFKPKNGAPNLITVVLDDNEEQDVSPGPNPKFEFTATKPVNKNHRCRVECDFQGAASPPAIVEVTLSGSEDSDTFKVSIDSSLPDPLFRFKVTAA